MADDLYEISDQKVYMVREGTYLTPYQGTKVTALTAKYPHLIPLNIVPSGFDYSLPRRLHQKLWGIGSGKHPSMIVNTKQEPVTFSIDTNMQNALMLSYAVAGGSGCVTPSGSTYQVGTITCVAEASMTNSGYFFLDVTDEDGTQDHYEIWTDVNSGGSSPAVGFGCTATEFDVATSATANTNATNLATLIDNLDHVGASATDNVVTVTAAEGLGGAAINMRDGAVATGMAFATTTKGVTTHTVVEGTGRTLGSFTLHIEQAQDTAAESIYLDLFGCVVSSHTTTIDYEEGLVKESVEITCPHYAISVAITNLPPQHDTDHPPHAWVNLTEAASKYLLMTGTTDVTPKIVTKTELKIVNELTIKPEIGYSYAQHVVATKRNVTLNIVGNADDSDRLTDFIDTWTNNSVSPASSYYTTLAARLNSVVKLQRDSTTDYFELSVYNWIIDEHALRITPIDEGLVGFDMTLSGATPDANKRIIPTLVIVDYISDFQYE